MILAITKRWHLWRYRAAKWLLGSAVVPLWTWLNAMTRLDAKAANDQHDKARLRMEICKRCPMFDATLKRCKECGCFMPAKVQFPDAKCPQGRW